MGWDFRQIGNRNARVNYARVWSVDAVKRQCHGDMWMNNFLFKYDINGLPIEVQLASTRSITWMHKEFRSTEKLNKIPFAGWLCVEPLRLTCVWFIHAFVQFNAHKCHTSWLGCIDSALSLGIETYTEAAIISRKSPFFVGYTNVNADTNLS